jgi:pyruvate,water dikinase
LHGDKVIVSFNDRLRDRSWVRPFAGLHRTDVPPVGGKGANLGEMTAAGLPVPPVFMLTIEAYRRFYENKDLGRPWGKS